MATQAYDWSAAGTDRDTHLDERGYTAEDGPVEGLTQRAFDLCGGAMSALQERPILALGLLAAFVGALVGRWLASRSSRPAASIPMPDLPKLQELPDRSDLRRFARRSSAELRSRVPDDGAELIRGQFKAGLALVPVLLRLLSNPLVQGYLRRAIARRLSR
jgi:hypothetical protein